MILVGQYDSPYVRRVAVSLHLLGLAFTRNTISGFADADKMRRINPLGRIPSLILDDGEVLIDSAAILDHLDEGVGPDRALLPASGRERRHALRIVALATGIIDKAGAIVYERTLRPAEKVHVPWIERCRIQVDSALAALEALTGAGFYLRDRPMQPDVTVGCMLAYVGARLPEARAGGTYPKLEAFAETAAGLDAFAATEPAPDETMPGTLT
ncbi:MAG TPA: glutathione S-transferase [Haliangiales bacterium]|nr:glutathione S-transferase [Haliangiales bacterium]